VLKFRNKLDRNIFCADVGRLDLMDESLEIPEELYEDFVKRRKKLVFGLKDFRRSQNAKAMWRKHRYKILKGIKHWHKSTAGKRFHRNLGRFLATRIFRKKNESFDKYETLKAVCSLRTHMYVDGEYFRSLDEQIDYENLIEYAQPLLIDTEIKLLEDRSGEITEDEVELLFRLVNLNPIYEQLSDFVGENIDTLRVRFESCDIDEDLTYGITLKLLKISEVDSEQELKLKELMDNINE
jgi:hypothetical protein